MKKPLDFRRVPQVFHLQAKEEADRGRERTPWDCWAASEPPADAREGSRPTPMRGLSDDDLPGAPAFVKRFQ